MRKQRWSILLLKRREYGSGPPRHGQASGTLRYRSGLPEFAPASQAESLPETRERLGSFKAYRSSAALKYITTTEILSSLPALSASQTSLHRRNTHTAVGSRREEDQPIVQRKVAHLFGP